MQWEHCIISMIFLSDTQPKYIHEETLNKLNKQPTIFKDLRIMKVKEWGTVPDGSSRAMTTTGNCNMWFWTGLFCSEVHYWNNWPIIIGSEYQIITINQFSNFDGCTVVM